jgi:ribonuclease BN (tRNA processing enzyme)
MQMSTAAGGGPDWLRETFNIRFFSGSGSINLESLSAILLPVQHFIPATAVRIGGFVYSADLGQGSLQELAEFSSGAEILLCEAAIPDVLEGDHPARAGHLSPSQAGQAAALANVGQLLLTHVPINYNPELALQQARLVFANTTLACSGKKYDLEIP